MLRVLVIIDSRWLESGWSLSVVVVGWGRRIIVKEIAGVLRGAN